MASSFASFVTRASHTFASSAVDHPAAMSEADAGQTVVLFWSMSDRDSAKNLRQLQELHEQGWCTVAVNVDSANRASHVRPFMHRLGVRGVDVQLDRTGSIAQDFQAQSGDLMVQSDPASQVAWQRVSAQNLGPPAAAQCQVVAALR